MTFPGRLAAVIATALAFAGLTAGPAAAETATISGVISAAETGDPLDACVTAITADEHFWTETECTDSAGSYSISVPADTYVLLVEAEDYVSTYHGGLTIDAATPVVVVDGGNATVDAALGTGVAVTGTITAADNGEPVFTCLSAEPPTGHASRGQSCTDAATGAFAIGGLVDGLDYQIEVFDADWFVGTTLSVTAPGDVDVSLERGARVDVTLSDPDGDPANDVTVWVRHAELGNFVGAPTVGGHFNEFVPAGEIKVRFESEFGVQWAIGQPNLDTATVFTAEPGETLFIEDMLVDDPGGLTGTISGTITTAGTGEPIAGACAVLQPDDGSAEQQACSDSSGDYSMDLPGGLYRVQFVDPTGFHATAYFGGDVDDATPVTVFAGEELADIDGELTPAGVITGRAVDAETGDPVENVCVAPRAASDNTFVDHDGTCSDAAGFWQVAGVPGGDYKLRVDDLNGRYAMQWFDQAGTVEAAEVITVVPGEATDVGDVRMLDGGTVTGVVTDQHGNPIEGAWVSLGGPPASRAGFGEGQTDRTNSEGVYTITNIPPGEHLFGVATESSEYAWTWNGGAPTSSLAPAITVEPGETVTVDFTLPPTATLTLVGDLDHSVEFDVYTDDGDLIGVGGFIPAGGDGRAWGLPTSSVRLHLHWIDADGKRHSWWYVGAETLETSTPIDVVAGEETQVTIDLTASPPVDPTDPSDPTDPTDPSDPTDKSGGGSHGSSGSAGDGDGGGLPLTGVTWAGVTLVGVLLLVAGGLTVVASRRHGLALWRRR